MQSLSETPLPEFQLALTPERLRIFRVIYAALGSGVLFISTVAIAMHTGIARELQEGAVSTISAMTVVNLLFGIFAILVGRFLSGSRFSDSNLRAAVTRDFTNEKGQAIAGTPAEKCFSLILTSAILRIALLEGAGFFGAVTVIVGAQNGALQVEPRYLCNLITPLFVLVYIGFTFPTPQRLEGIFREKIQKTM